MVTRVVSAGRNREEQAVVPRRTALRLFLSGSLVTVFTSLVYPILRYLVPPKEAAVTANNAVAGAVGELKPNTAKIFRFGNRPALLVRLASGEYRSMSAVCTHLGCTVQYQPETQQIWCPCHNGRYDMTGKNILGPPPRPLHGYNVQVVGEEIHVSRSQDA